MSKSQVFVSAFWVISNEKWEILFWKRKNTGFADAYYQLPSGHLEVDEHESIEECCCRELKEEVWITVLPQDLRLRFFHHSYWPGTNPYMWYFFDVLSYSGDIINTEPHKCEHLKWIHPDNFSEYRIIKYTKENLLDDSKWVVRWAYYEKKEEFLG